MKLLRIILGLPIHKPGDKIYCNYYHPATTMQHTVLRIEGREYVYSGYKLKERKMSIIHGNWYYDRVPKGY